MKTIRLGALLLGLLTVYGLSAAQSPRPFWNIERNPRVYSYTLVRYYSADRRLIGEEKIARPWIDISRRRNIRLLDRRLRDHLIADSLNRVAVLRRK
ncbi:MAG: hypothetical protein JNN04_17205 [Cyclobacteriaceae bacterium]|nr:hypothetical protein [Cyclobacteriaceae bacterium]